MFKQTYYRTIIYASLFVGTSLLVGSMEAFRPSPQHIFPAFTSSRNPFVRVNQCSSQDSVLTLSSSAVAFGFNETASEAPVSLARRSSSTQLPTAEIKAQASEVASVLTHQHGITTITGIPQFLEFIYQDRDAGEDQRQLCVIKYHAVWCKVCQRVAVKYKKLAHDFGATDSDERCPVRFGDVEVSANPDLSQKIGIKVFPFVEMYERGVKVAAFSTGPSYKFNLVRDTIREKLSMSTEDKLAFHRKFEKEIHEAICLLDSLREEKQLSP